MKNGSPAPVIDTNAEVNIGKYCMEYGFKLAAAESCTGGLVGHRITNVPGSSNYFLGSIVAYDYSIKRGLLKVDNVTLEEYGAVSKETALEMAEGARKVLSLESPFEKTIGLSVTGIAGPGGETPEKPVGLVWIGICAQGYQKSVHYVWDGSRTENKMYSAQAALNLLLDTIKLIGSYERAFVQYVNQPSGKIDPRSVFLLGREHPITAIGRRWQDELGEHIMAMVQIDQTIELILSEENQWLIKKIASPKQTV